MTLRALNPESKLPDCVLVGAVERIVPRETIEAVFEETGARTPRKRKLNLPFVALWLILLNLFRHLAYTEVLEEMAGEIDLQGYSPDFRLPTAGALVYRRHQLGVRPMAALFHRICRPIATPKTRGAFRFGLRLMAFDGSVEDVPDTPANEKAFGRHSTDRGNAAFPQLLGVYLIECATHVIVDAGFWPCHTSEEVGVRRLLRSVVAGMLVMWDRGLQSYDLLRAVRDRGAHGLGRLPINVKPTWIRTLPDGSWLAWLMPSDRSRRKAGERMLVRIIEYTITNPKLSGYGEIHRLVTTLLDPEQAPARELVLCYHERWEIELVIDEVDVHQRLANQPLRSQDPQGVLQELYALLLSHYVIRSLMHETAVREDLDPDRLSFTHALRVIQRSVPLFQLAALEEWPGLFERLMKQIANGRLPERRFRSNARVVKRKMSNFPLKRPEHRPGVKLDGNFGQAFALI